MWSKVVESGVLGIKAMPLQPLYASSAVFHAGKCGSGYEAQGCFEAITRREWTRSSG